MIEKLKNINSLDIFFDNSKFEEAVMALENYVNENKIKSHTYKLKKPYQIKIMLNKKDKAENAIILTTEPEAYKGITQYKKVYIFH